MSNIAPLHEAPVPPVARVLEIAAPVARAMKLVSGALEAFKPHERPLLSEYWPNAYAFHERFDVGALEGAQATLSRACEAPFDPRKTIAMLGPMLDSIPSAKNLDGKTYRQAITSLLGAKAEQDGLRVGPEIVALAMQNILLAEEYAPAPCVVLAYISSARHEVMRRLREAQQMLTARKAFYDRGPPPTREEREIERKAFDDLQARIKHLPPAELHAELERADREDVAARWARVKAGKNGRT